MTIEGKYLVIWAKSLRMNYTVLL